MSKEKDLAKNTAIISVGRICTQFMSFFLLPLYTSILSTKEYGTVDLLISYSSLLLPAVTFAVEQALFRFLIDVRHNEGEKSKIISTAVLFAVFQCVICAILLGIIQLFLQNQYMPYFILMVTACIFSAISLQLSRGLGDNIGYALGSFITAAVQIFCNILFLVIFRMGAKGMLLAAAAGNIACFMLLCIKLKVYKYIHMKSFQMKTLKELLQYSVPLIPNQLSWWVMNASDKTIVAIFLGTAGNGLLAVANKFPSVYIQFNTIFNISWTESATMHINDDDAEEFFSEIINSVFKLFSCVCTGMIVCIPFVISWLVDESYYDAYYQIPIYLLASLCHVVVSLYGVIYVAHKKTKEIAMTALYAAAINVGSHLLLIHFIGLYAASISSLLGYGAMAVYRYFHSRKYLTIKFSAKLILKVIFMMVISFVTYYLRNMVFHVIAFVIILLMSVYMNRDMAVSLMNLGKRKMSRIFKKSND